MLDLIQNRSCLSPANEALFFVLIVFVSNLNLYSQPLSINIFASKNGKGLEMDQTILAEALTEIGCSVNCLDFYSKLNENSFADINIFFEKLVPLWFLAATKNWFIPNPEWCNEDNSALNEVNLILCRTHAVEKIFKNLGMKTFFLGFTSKDCYDPLVKKDYRIFFHLAGGSLQKGSESILSIWKKNPQLPLLNMIKWWHNMEAGLANLNLINERVDPTILSKLQNQCGVHLCPSETEGFGHYLMEALSTKAVVVTTDAPPMNEFVSDFLIPYQSFAQQYLGTNYYVDQEALQLAIETISKMSRKKLKNIGKKNRKIYLQKTDEFKKNLNLLILNTQDQHSDF